MNHQLDVRDSGDHSKHKNPIVAKSFNPIGHFGRQSSVFIAEITCVRVTGINNEKIGYWSKAPLKPDV